MTTKKISTTTALLSLAVDLCRDEQSTHGWSALRFVAEAASKAPAGPLTTDEAYRAVVDLLGANGEWQGDEARQVLIAARDHSRAADAFASADGGLCASWVAAAVAYG